MGKVIEFYAAADALRKKQIEAEISKSAAAQCRERFLAGSAPLSGNLDSSDDWEQYHVYPVKKDGVWEVWLPYDDACMLTFPEEARARTFARDLNSLVGSGVAVYTGMPPISPSYA